VAKSILLYDAVRILTQDVLDNAHPLDKLAPVHRPQKSELPICCYGNLIGGQLLALRTVQLLDRQAGSESRCSIQVSGSAKSGALPLQPARKFRDKTNSPSADRPRHIRNHQIRLFGSFSAIPSSGLPNSRRGSVDPVGGDPGANAPEILDQCQTHIIGIAHNSPNFRPVTVW